MSPSDNNRFLRSLEVFADTLKKSYSSLVAAQQKDQLKAPTGKLLSEFGGEFGLNVIPRFEAPVEDVGRPDIALDVDARAGESQGGGEASSCGASCEERSRALT